MYVALNFPTPAGVVRKSVCNSTTTGGPKLLTIVQKMKKVLVVDDNALMRKMIISLLMEENLVFEEAADGRDALDMIEKFAYDLVITDILMPRLEGTELIMEIRKKRPDSDIIAISGGKPYYLYVAKKLGVKAVFTKPLNPTMFHETVKRMLHFRPDALTLAS